MCTLLEISRAGFYEWLERKPSTRARENARLTLEIQRIHSASRKTYGSPRVHAELLANGTRVCRHRVARLMREARLQGAMRRRFCRTTDSRHSLPVAPNLLDRKFTVRDINTHWVSDLTYLPTREGWLYLAVIVDLSSRAIVGWSMNTTLRAEIVVDALEAALQRRKPRRRILFHSDCGSQYVSEDFLSVARRHQMQLSMSRRANCWDNAVAESFFGTMKTELGHPVWATRAEARAAVFDYIEVWYNRQRRHSSIGYVSPEMYERQIAQAA